MPAGVLKTYDPASVVISIGGVPMGGFSEGTFLTVERNEDAFTEVVGADGETTRSKSNNKSGIMTLTLKQSSASNDVLSGFLIADELNGSGVVPVLIEDLEGTTLIASAKSYVKKIAGPEFAKEASDREWVIAGAAIEMFVGGNTEN